MPGNGNEIIERLRAQLEESAREYADARRGLDAVVEDVIADIRDNLRGYVLENVKRALRRKPEQIAALEGGRLDELRGELDAEVDGALDAIISALRNFRGWYGEDTLYIGDGSAPWKAVKSIEEPVNRTLRKFEIGPIELKNWTWLSAGAGERITTTFTAAKRKFIDARKRFQYVEGRYKEETRISAMLETLDGM